MVQKLDNCRAVSEQLEPQPVLLAMPSLLLVSLVLQILIHLLNRFGAATVRELVTTSILRFQIAAGSVDLWNSSGFCTVNYRREYQRMQGLRLSFGGRWFV